MRNLSPDAKTPELRDFRYIGIIWVVQVKHGWRSEFYRLSDLQRYLSEGRIQPTDLLSHDRETWIPIDQIADLSAHFDSVWHLASQGKLKVRHEIGRGYDFDDESPTQVVSVAQLRAELQDTRHVETDPLRLSPPGIEAFEMPEDDASGGLEAPAPCPALSIEDEPTMEPSADLSSPPRRSAPLQTSAGPASAPPPGTMARVFLSGLLSGLAVFGLLLWLAGG